MTESKIALVCKALGDENRVVIMKMLTGGELCACKILDALNVSQPTLSHHMKVLTDCNLVSSRKDGKWTYYSINCESFAALLRSSAVRALSRHRRHDNVGQPLMSSFESLLLSHPNSLSSGNEPNTSSLSLLS